MENNIRFRNHISVIFENSVKSLGTFFVIFLMSFFSDMAESDTSMGEVLLLIGILAAGLVIVLGWQTLIWAKTYISIQDNVLIVERNTLNRKRNTIGLSNISNVNLEQNVLEMIFGTCKVKLDTNSLSTADETDVKIVLKKADAEWFRRVVLGEAEVQQAEAEPNLQSSNPQSRNGYTGSMGDIVLHGLFSIHISSVIFLIALIVIGIIGLANMTRGEIGEGIAELFGSIFVFAWFVGGIIWSMFKEFVKYLNFRIERKENKVFLSYGLLKKVAYSIPVDKINAIRLVQTPIARMGGRYMAEVINVGMDDDENESNTFLLPYAKKEKIKAQLNNLLPEFAGCMDISEEKQPKSIWVIWIPRVLVYLCLVAVAYGIVMEFVPEFKMAPIYIGAGLGLWLLILKIFSYFTKGLAVHNQFLKIVEGAFGRKMMFVRYDKIQYITGKQNVLANCFHVQKGNLFLLASLTNRVHELPYFKEEQMETLKQHLIEFTRY